ncbi:MAG: hypothetical protein JJU28_24765 [Cyclobacteriaceae bacterium]|nr:hypothetical protein [Cyclobacteriaceae bacterium]
MKILEIFGAIAALSVLLVPFYLLIRLQKRREKSLKKLFLEKCKSAGINPDYTEILDLGRIIGLDKENSRLLFLNNTDDIMHFEALELAKVQKCEIQKKNIQLKEGNKSRSVVESVDLVFTLRAQVYLKPISLNFFNYHKDEPLKLGFYEIKAKEWQEVIRKIRDQLATSAV